ncbi:MAG: hypothetical protein ABFD76_10080 [Smithella sp.]
MLEIIVLAIVMIFLSFGIGAFCAFVLIVIGDDKEQDDDYNGSDYPRIKQFDEGEVLDAYNLLMYKKQLKEKRDVQKSQDEECLIQNDPML